MRIPELEQRPEVPGQMVYPLRLYQTMGGTAFPEVEAYCRAAGIDDVWWLWHRMCAVREVLESG